MRRPLLIFFAALACGCIDTSGLVFDRDSVPAGTDYPQDVLIDGPLAYWPLDVLEMGTRTPDVSGNGHDAYIDDGSGNGTVTFGVEGALGTAATLADGGRLFVDAPNPLQFGSSSYTLELWLRVTSAQFPNVVSSSDQSGNQGGYATFLSTTSLTHKRYSDASFEEMGQEPIALSEMRHVAISYDAERNEGQFVVDGEPLFLPPRTLMLTWNAPAAVFLLASTGMGDNITIDEVAVYDFPLPLERIQHHHCAATQSCE